MKPESTLNVVAKNNKQSDPRTRAATKLKRKRSKSKNGEKVSGSRHLPKRAAACSDFKEKAICFSEKSSLVKPRKEVTVADEIAALDLTSVQDEPIPNRRLKDFTFHDAHGYPQGIEMLEVNNLFISALILPLEESQDTEKEKGVRCDGFGRVESWAISGWEEGLPVVWISTALADYECVKPSAKYKWLYNLFFEKAHACIEVYRKLSRSCGGNPNLSLDELIVAVVRSMSSSKNFSHGTSIKDFIISHGKFIYYQLIGLDETSTENDEVFTGLPVLVALRDERRKHKSSVTSEANPSERMLNASPKIGGELIDGPQEEKDMKLSTLQQEKEHWMSMNKKDHKFRGPSSNIYIKINEDEIANDYPLPAYYRTSVEETDEFIAIHNDGNNGLPENTLHNWTLYNSDARLISLELLPMRPCADIDATIFGSGIMIRGGSGFYFDVDSNQSSSGSTGMHSEGLQIYLSAIKEWKIEFGPLMMSISIRTDMSWYRLGRPSKQYAPWFEPVLKTARLAISIITLLKGQSRVSRLSFVDVIRKVSEYDKQHPAFISSNPVAVAQYVVVHGPIILQLFAEYPDKTIGKCPFITVLQGRMVDKHHTKWKVNKKRVLEEEINLNPREAVSTFVSKRKAMPATTTRLINRIWGDYYSNYSPESKGMDTIDMKEDTDAEEEEEEGENGDEDSEDVEEQKMQFDAIQLAAKPTKSRCSDRDIQWDGDSVGKTSTGMDLHKWATVHGEMVAVGDFVLVETAESNEFDSIYFVEYMFENSDGRKMVHGRLLLQGCQTVLGNAANERELFLTNDCLDFVLDDVKQTVLVEIRSIPWGHQYRKSNAHKDKIDRERAEERKRKGLPQEYYCKSLYWPEKGAFVCLPKDNMGLASGFCHSCRIKETQGEMECFKLTLPGNGFTYKGTQYHILDFVYLAPHHFAVDGTDHETFKSGRNVGLRPYVVCQLLEIEVCKASRQASPESIMVKIRRFFRPEDISTEKAYCSDIREVYYSEQILSAPYCALEGKCEVRSKCELLPLDSPAIFEHIFFCEYLYDPDNGVLKQLPAHIKLSSSKQRMVDDAAYRQRKGKCKEGENGFHDINQKSEASTKNRLATLDIFAGCGGLSEGLERAGVSLTKWAIEYEEAAADAFRLNHPEAMVFNNNCSVILRAIMSACGDADDCVSTSEACELAKNLDEKMISDLPRPGEVEFINGGPPCQGFSGLNRFNQGTWSKVQCEMILAFLSFADYFRPRFFLLENVRNFVSFNKAQTFRLTVASLLEMGYQVKFGILEAGAYGVSQSRKRAFIWAASPEELLPEWPEPMHVFAGRELKITLSENCQYAAVRSTANGAPFRAITVRDTIGDLPAVGNGATMTTLEYKNQPVSWFQQMIREDMPLLNDHISKEMNELNLIRCKKIPKRPGADWRDLPYEKVRLSTGQVVDLIPWCLPNTAKRHNQWKGLFGRLDWNGNFPTSVTDPQPMGKVGMCFHPEQDRILTVRECARSQGFPDSYKFSGNIHHKHRQIGNAVPPPLAFALGKKLKEAIEMKHST